MNAIYASFLSYCIGVTVVVFTWHNHYNTNIEAKTTQCATACAPYSSELQEHDEKNPWVCKCGNGAEFTTNWTKTAK